MALFQKISIVRQVEFLKQMKQNFRFFSLRFFVFITWLIMAGEDGCFLMPDNGYDIC